MFQLMSELSFNFPYYIKTEIIYNT